MARRLIVCGLALLAAGLVSLSAQDAATKARARLTGLGPADVEARIGAPTEKDDLADSAETYWTYKTQVGTLVVHFQNNAVVDIDPPDFPVEAILK